MMILKLSSAVALNELAAVAVRTWDSVAAVSGSNRAAPLINPLNAHDVFTIEFSAVRLLKVAADMAGTLMNISRTAALSCC